MKKVFKNHGIEDFEQSVNGRYRIDGEYCYITIDNDELKFFILENYSGLYIYTEELECTFNRVKE